MTSNFALSLSFDGIRLLHRVPDGWHLVGEVALDVEDLGAELAELREKALGIAPDGLRTKLLIPDSQIKYLTIDSAQTSLEDIHAALDGATPYAIDDLKIDFDRTGGRTYIAAVAQETLDEAEAFAADHEFAPVSFAAVPEPLTFRSEVFFGATKVGPSLVNGTEITRDDAPTIMTGTVADPEETAKTKALPSFLAGKKPDPSTEVEPQSETLASEEDAEPAVFASRHRDGSAEKSTPPEPLRDPAEATTDEPTTEEEEVVFASRKSPPTLAVPTGIVDGPRITPAVTAPPGPLPDLTVAPPDPVTAPPVTGQPQDTTTAGFSSRRKTEPPVSKPQEAVEPAPVVAAPPAPAPVIPTSPRQETEVTAPPKAAKPTKPAPAFGDPKTPRVGGKPRYLGLMLTAGLIVFLFLVALWANTLSPDGLAGWFRGDTATEVADIPEVENTTVAAAPVVEALPAPVETTAPSALAPEETPAGSEDDAQQALPIVRAPAGKVLSPADADRIYAATGVYQRAPRLPLIPREATLDGFIESRPLPASAAIADLAMPDVTIMLPDAVIREQRNPPAADVVFQRDLRGFILATPEGVLTPDGALVFAGRPEIAPPARPGSEETVVAATAPASPVVAPPALDPDTGVILVAGRPPLVPPLRPDGLAPAEPSEDASASSDEDAVEAAIAEAATAEVAIEGLVVVSGRPARVPPLRPAAFADRAQETEVAAIFADPALAGYRPALRPAGLAPPSEPEPEEPNMDLVIAAIAEAAPPSAFQNVTARAIAASRRPDTRPRNFATVVARAQSVIARQQTQAASVASAPQRPAQAAVAASAAPASPSGPVPGSVAQAATMDNAIRLRDMNLIGVYGRPNARRALVRLGNGRYVKVEVGSSLDGGRVTAIGDSALNFVKRGRTYALQLPQS